MKKCVNCKINVGGQSSQCPICQNALTGEGTPFNWPAMSKLRRQFVIFKVQLFIVLACSFISAALDFLLEINSGKHWSIPVVFWAVSFELLIRHFLRRSVVPAAIVTDCTIHTMLCVLITTRYLGGFAPVINIVVPIVLSMLLVTNLVLSFVDRHGNAMVYLLVSVLIAILSYVFMYIRWRGIPTLWTICMMINVVIAIGVCVFKGRNVLNEIQKRMSI